MLLNKEFIQFLSVEIQNHNKHLSVLHTCLVDFKNRGMDKESVQRNLEGLRNRCDSDMEDILFDLMVFVVEFCSPV